MLKYIKKKKLPTLKFLEKELNKVPIPEEEKHYFNGKKPTKNYGTWLRRNDPKQFQLIYNELIRTL